MKYLPLMLCLLLFGCKDKLDIALKKSQKEMLVYNEGDNFKLMNVATGEVSTFSVNSISYYYEDDYSNNGFFPTLTDVRYQVGKLDFSNDSNCYGSIYTRATNDDSLDMHIELNGCFGQNFYEFGPYEEGDPYQIGFQNYYLFSTYPPRQLFYSKERGILAIEDDQMQINYISVD